MRDGFPTLDQSFTHKALHLVEGPASWSGIELNGRDAGFLQVIQCCRKQLSANTAPAIVWSNQHHSYPCERSTVGDRRHSSDNMPIHFSREATSGGKLKQS